MSNTPTLKLKGASGREYAFLVYPWGREFKSVGAVYAATRCTSNTGEGTHTIVYIGQTADPSERFDNHHKADCLRRHGVNCICVHEETNEKARLAIGADLIAAYKPPCNG